MLKPRPPISNETLNNQTIVNDNMTTFKVTIEDPYTAYSYTFRLDEHTAIYDIAKAIAKRFKVDTPAGTLVSQENRDTGHPRAKESPS